MKIRTFGYFFRQAFISMVRNAWMSFASISSVAASLIILGGFLLLAINVDYIASDVESQVEVTAYLNDDLSTEDTSTVGREITQLSGVTEVIFISKEDALNNFKEQLGEHGSLLEGLDEGVMPASYRIKAENPNIVDDIAQQVGLIKGVEDVEYGKEVVAKLLKLTHWMRIIGLGAMGMFGIISVFIISNTIRLTVFARRKEISIMKYIGATDWFIRWPFLIEGMVLGFVGAVLAVGSLNGAYYYIFREVQLNLPIIKLLPQNSLLIIRGSAGFLGIGMLLGAIGSSVSIRRFLRV
jgi:cell division transport system permease protein